MDSREANGDLSTPALLVVLMAPPGAGKTSWIRRHRFPRWQVLSLDDYRWQLTGDEADQSATGPAAEMLHTAVRYRMGQGITTVVDATNAVREDRDKLVQPAIGWMVPVCTVVLHTPLAVCIERQDARRRATARAPNGKFIPRKVIEGIHKQVHGQLTTATEYGPAVHVSPDGSTAVRWGFARRELLDAHPWLGAEVPHGVLPWNPVEQPRDPKTP